MKVNNEKERRKKDKRIVNINKITVFYVKCINLKNVLFDVM